MPVFKVAGDATCDLCGKPLVIRCSFGVREGWGICNECGIEYTFTPARPDVSGGVIDSAECQAREGGFDWRITESYYSDTENTAVIASFIDFEDAEVQAFHEWRETVASKNS